jgi:hypothetical protein
MANLESRPQAQQKKWRAFCAPKALKGALLPVKAKGPRRSTTRTGSLSYRLDAFRRSATLTGAPAANDTHRGSHLSFCWPICCQPTNSMRSGGPRPHRGPGGQWLLRGTQSSILKPPAADIIHGTSHTFSRSLAKPIAQERRS